MKKSNLEAQRGAFSCGDRADDLMYWAEKIAALGNTIEEICDESVCGDHLIVQLASIIREYAQALHDELDKAYHALSKFYSEGGDTGIYQLTQDCEHLALRRNGRPWCEADQNDLWEIEGAIDAELADLQECLELKKKISELKTKFPPPKDSPQAIIAIANNCLSVIKKQGGILNPGDYDETIERLENVVRTYGKSYPAAVDILEALKDYQKKGAPASVDSQTETPATNQK